SVDRLQPQGRERCKDMDVNQELRIGHGSAVTRRQTTNTTTASTLQTGQRVSWWRRPRALVLVLGMAALGLLLGGCGPGTQSGALPSVRVQVGGPEGGDSMSVGVQLLLLLTVLSLVPAILMMVTSFIRIAIVLSFARSAIGMQQMPPNQILLGLSLF